MKNDFGERRECFPRMEGVSIRRTFINDRPIKTALCTSAVLADNFKRSVKVIFWNNAPLYVNIKTQVVTSKANILVKYYMI